MKYIRTFFIIAALSILAFGAFHTKAKASSDTVAQIVVVPAGRWSEVILPPGQIAGFSCAAGISDVSPNCYILIK